MTASAPLAPSALIKWGMKQVALTKDLGTLDWLRRNDCEDRIEAFFGSRKQQQEIGGWDSVDSEPPSQNPIRLSHGYDETKELRDLTIEDMKEAARFRGGECLSSSMEPGDLDSQLDWECGCGLKFRAKPRTILLGGHWCPKCNESWDYEKQAEKNQFLRQVWDI